MLGKIKGKRRKRQQRMSWLDSIADTMDMHLSRLWEIAEDRGSWRVAGLGNSQGDIVRPGFSISTTWYLRIL